MSSLYENIEKLCKANDITVTDLCRNLDIPRAVLSDLKAGRSQSINLRYVDAISSYFKVTIDCLIGRKNYPVTSNDDGISTGAKMLDEALKRHGFDSSTFSEEDLRIIVAMLKAKYNK